MKLFLFPEVPGRLSGYQIAVSSDVNQFSPTEHDCVVYICSKDMSLLNTANVLYINRNTFSMRLLGLLSTGHPSFFSGWWLAFLIGRYFKTWNFSSIYYGDINFVRLSRFLRTKKSLFRLHNLYHRMWPNLSLYQRFPKSAKFHYECWAGSRLEREIFQSRNHKAVRFSFISHEEREYATRLYHLEGVQTDVIKFEEHFLTKPANDKIQWDGRLVWFGGLSSHKLVAMNYFCSQIFPKIKTHPKFKSFELIGQGTEEFDNEAELVFGRGFVANLNFEEYKDAFFINPDIISGGVKLKMLDLYRHNLQCLSTPFGVEGLEFSADWKRLRIAPIEDWPKIIENE